MATKAKTNEKKLTFEAALKGLEESSNALKSEDSSLEEAMNSFEEGIKYYNLCNEILTAAKQKIEVYKQEQ